MFKIKQVDYKNRSIGKLFRKSKIEHIWQFILNKFEFQGMILESVYTDKIRFYINHHFINVVKATKKQKAQGILFSVPGVDFIFKKSQQDFEVSIDIKQNFKLDHCFWKQVFCQQIKKQRSIMEESQDIQYQSFKEKISRTHTLGQQKSHQSLKNRSVDLQSNSFKNFLKQSLLLKDQQILQQNFKTQVAKDQALPLKKPKILETDFKVYDKMDLYRDSLGSHEINQNERDSTISKKVRDKSDHKYQKIDQILIIKK